MAFIKHSLYGFISPSSKSNQSVLSKSFPSVEISPQPFGFLPVCIENKVSLCAVTMPGTCN